MRSSPLFVIALAAAAAASVAACSDDAPVDPGPDAQEGCDVPNSMRLNPLVIGATWTYAISEPMVPPRNKTSTIEALEDVGGRKAGTVGYRQKTEKLDGVTISWNEDRCTSVVRHRERNYDLSNVEISDQFYQPSKLRVDETRLTTGAQWTLSYTELEVNPATQQTVVITKDEMWSVVSASESVTVGGMTFPNAVHFHKLTSGAAEKDYWFVPGVGKVKETGEQTEELTSYMIPASP